MCHLGVCASKTDLDDANLLALGVVWRATPLPNVSLLATPWSSLTIEREAWMFGATYVGESGVWHFDRFPGESVGDYL
jgi:hypothetical protein